MTAGILAVWRTVARRCQHSVPVAKLVAAFPFLQPQAGLSSKMGSPVQPQAQQALGPLEVFIDTQLPTRIFMRCHLLDSMSDLQGSLPVCIRVLVALQHSLSTRCFFVLPGC